MDDDHLFQGEAPTRSVGPTLGDATGADPDAPPLLRTGDDFGPYHVVRMLGRGGMGEVYEVEDRDNARRVALKVLSNRLSGPADRARFIREGRLAAGISHANTVYVYGTDDIDGIPVIAMELAPGGTLKDRVKMKGPLGASEAVDAILQAVSGLDAAADAGVLHRDIKPSNCFVDSDGTVKVGDFGLSISTQTIDERSLTMLGTVLGTPGFSSPEQLRGDELDLRSDIYSVGATLYYLLTGKAPFDDPNVIRLVTQVAQEMPPPVRVARPDVPADLAAVVMRCLAKRPADRYQTYESLREALEPFSSNAPAPAPLGVRFGAGIVDNVILTLLTMPVASLFWEGFTPTTRSGMVKGTVVGWVVLLLYYGVSEGLWGRSIGKWLFGLRVVDLSNHRLGLPRGLLRAAAWIVSDGIPLLAYTAWLMPVVNASQDSPMSAVLGLSVPVFSLLLLVVIFSTARRHNGYAAVHDLATKTRVVVHRRAEDRVRGSTSTAVTMPVSTRERIGPYLLLNEQPLGTPDVVTAYDDRLRRRVWIHMRQATDPPLTTNRRVVARPARLRWLGGRRTEAEAWDAYEAPDGMPLARALEAGSSWDRVRFWLLDLATEIRAAQAGGTSVPLTLDRVWITPAGRARLLDWGGTAEGMTPELFLHDIARRGAAAPLPLHAQAFLARLEGKSFDNMDALVQSLGALVGEPADVRRGRRVAHLIISSVPAGFMGLIMVVTATAIVWSQSAPTRQSDLSESLMRLQRLQSDPERVRKPGEEQALEVYVAARYADVVRDDRTWKEGWTLLRFNGRFLRPRAEAILARHPSPTPAEEAAAAAIVEPFLKAEREKSRQTASPRGLLSIAAFFAAGFTVVMAIIGLLSALLFRGGLLLRLLGIAIVTEHAQASRPRAFWRAVVAWSPAVLSGLAVALGSPDGTPASGWLIIEAISLALIIAGIAYAVRYPARGIQDRVAGTWLVPR